METVVVTGWGYGHALAAAVALQKVPDAALYVASKRRLPELLERVVQEKETAEVLILGIDLSCSAAHLKRALQALRKNGSEVRFITVYDLPVDLKDEFGGLLDVQLCSEVGSLAHAVQKALKLKSNDRVVSFLRQMEKHPKQLNDAERQRKELIDAAASRYRRFQDVEAYPEVIREIAAGLPVSDSRKRMLAEFRRYGHRELRGDSRGIRELHSLINRIAKQDCRVLVTGETGVGKETVANLIHGHSERCSEPFVAFNCIDLNPQLLESRLFGHEEGAFTGAQKMRHGAFELADGGTLFLDEVGELSPGAQAGLLRVLQEGRFFRLGGEEEIEVDVRVIAATNRDLEEMIRKGSFRDDLYYRLNTVVLEVPPLRERLEDIPVIANNYLRSEGRSALSSKQVQQLQAYPWPGNVRELQNMLDRAHALNENDYSRILPRSAISASVAGERLDDAIRAHCHKIYERHDQNKARTAKALGISLNTLKKHLGRAKS